MPNWCFQNLTVYGRSEEDVKPFLDAIKNKKEEDDGDREYSLNQLVPRPKCLEGSVSGFFSDPEQANAHAEQEAKNFAECGYKNWYDWSEANWGTKWGACDVEFLDEYPVPDGHIATLKFESAWCPAVELIRNISNQYPRLLFSLSYTEESDAFAGVEVFAQGFAEDEFCIEPDFSDLPEYSEENPQAYYDAHSERQFEIIVLLDEKEEQLIASAKEAMAQ